MEILKNCINYFICNRRYRIDNHCTSSGRKVRRAWFDRRWSGNILGTEQGTFYGRCTCQIYEVLSMFIYDTGSSFESRCI